MSGEGHPLLLFPCNGNAVEALDCLHRNLEPGGGSRSRPNHHQGHRMIGFVDDTPAKQGTIVHGHPVHSRDAFARWPDARVLAVPGSPTSYRARKGVIDGLGVAGRFATVVHESARVSPLARIGVNVLIMAGVVVTSDAVIGDHVCILPNTVVHHDARIGDYSLIGSNVTIAGGTSVGRNCYVGSGTSLMNGLDIGDEALIGLGSNVIRNVPAGARVAGNPARAL